MSSCPRAEEAGGIHVGGHRGRSAGAPENTLPALEAAARLGATCYEVDPLSTRDERIVLRHFDPAGLARRAGAASVAIERDMFDPEDARA